jgi:hypothetical protein
MPSAPKPELSAESRRRRATLGGLSATRCDDPERIAEAHRLLAEARATDYIKNLVATWPAMSEDKRRELALLLAPDADPTGG